MSIRVAHVAALALPLAACSSSASTTSYPDGGTHADASRTTDAGKDARSHTEGGSSDAGVRDSGARDSGKPPIDSAVTQCSGTGASGYNPYKYAYFGDLHQHTSFSLDAYSFGTRTDPASAYLFAKGMGTVAVGSATTDPPGPVIMQPRPLDFLALTDHSEWLDITRGCTVDQSSAYYTSTECGLVRSTKAADQTLVFAELGAVNKAVCSGDAAASECNAEEMSAWQAEQAAAASAYVPCQFTSLIAYEWTDMQPVVGVDVDGGMSGTNHRNVIFGSSVVPSAPLTAIDYPKPPDLWTGLDSQCVADAGCQVVTIPHNTDLSGGVSLVVWDPTPAGVAQQEHYQIAAEIYQHKAGSECYYDPDAGYADPDCQFEYPSSKSAPNIGPMSFVREGLGQGVGYAAANTAQGNPFKLGIVGATDDHNGAPGNVDEATYVGHLGRDDDTADKRLANSPENGSGGLTGAWAEENTRESIFAAIQRRETFATSGPRMLVRFYQTSDASACSDPSFPQKIIDSGTGVPMGSTIGASALAGQSAPTFAVSVWPDTTPQALADGTDAGPGVAGIAKVQVIKVHAHMNGAQQVIVEDAPYLVSGISATGGCGTWTDPSFDGTEYSVYYVRAIQVPTWRWSHGSCATLKANFPSTWQTLAPGCEPGGALDVSIQERAWTSPIWFEP